MEDYGKAVRKMKKCLTMVLILCLLVLFVGGCGGTEDSVSSAPEVAVNVDSAANADAGATTTTEKEITIQKDTEQSTTCRCPLTSQITTTTSSKTTTVKCTYPTAPFTVGATVRERDEVFAEDFRGRIITSKTQLDALALDAEYETDSYTESYFEDKALVVLEFRLTSGSTQLRVDTVWASGDTMWVRYTTLHPNPSTADMAYRRILLEICQKSADGIKHVVGERVPIHLPSGSPPNPTAL